MNSNFQVVQSLASANPNLEHLVLDESESVGPNALKHLAQHCHDLLHLSLEGCLEVTDNSLVNLVTACHKLQFLRSIIQGFL